MSSQHAAPPTSDHLHAHLDGDAEHGHYIEPRSQKALAFALTLTLLFALVEVVTGFVSNSLALISDAGHMVTDAAALGLALLAQLIAKRPPSSRHSFGFVRAEALAAFVNCLAMLALVAWIVYEAVQRLTHPEPVQGGVVLVVAALGACINIAVAWVLSRDTDSINTRAALVNVMGDLLGSVAAIAAGAIIYFTGWVRIDPILSIFVSLLILKSTVGILSLPDGRRTARDRLPAGRRRPGRGRGRAVGARPARLGHVARPPCPDRPPGNRRPGRMAHRATPRQGNAAGQARDRPRDPAAGSAGRQAAAGGVSIFRLLLGAHADRWRAHGAA
jgi:Co/Zn/Cd efflux system component